MAVRCLAVGGCGNLAGQAGDCHISADGRVAPVQRMLKNDCDEDRSQSWNGPFGRMLRADWSSLVDSGENRDCRNSHVGTKHYQIQYSEYQQPNCVECHHGL